MSGGMLVRMICRKRQVKTGAFVGWAVGKQLKKTMRHQNSNSHDRAFLSDFPMTNHQSKHERSEHHLNTISVFEMPTLIRYAEKLMKSKGD